MNSNIPNGGPTGKKGPPLEATVADTMAEMAELAQQKRRPAEPAQRGRPAAAPGAARGGAHALSDSMRSTAIAGWTIIALFFGGFGAWAVTAPLHGAVVANGF